jgi:hypothetical protein
MVFFVFIISCTTTKKNVILNDNITITNQSKTVSVYTPYLDSILIYKDKSKGFLKNNVGFDWNSDKKIQNDEFIPESFQGADPDEMSVFQYLLDNFDRIPKPIQSDLSNIMKSQSINSVNENLGLIDILGSKLSRVGLHPFSERKIFYFPDGSGNKVSSKKVDFYPTGSPEKIQIDVTNENNTKLELKEYPYSVKYWNLYGTRTLNEHQGSKDSYWDTLNTVEFRESGLIKRIGNCSYIRIALPDEYGCSVKEAESSAIGWNPDGSIYEIVLAGGKKDETYTLPGGIVVSELYRLVWENDVDFCRVIVELNSFSEIIATFDKGEHTFYKEDQKTKKWVPYVKRFDKKTDITIQGGFFVDSKGNITNYW